MTYRVEWNGVIYLCNEKALKYISNMNDGLDCENIEILDTDVGVDIDGVGDVHGIFDW